MLLPVQGQSAIQRTDSPRNPSPTDTSHSWGTACETPLTPEVWLPGVSTAVTTEGPSHKALDAAGRAPDRRPLAPLHGVPSTERTPARLPVSLLHSTVCSDAPRSPSPLRRNPATPITTPQTPKLSVPRNPTPSSHNLPILLHNAPNPNPPPQMSVFNDISLFSSQSPIPLTSTQDSETPPTHTPIYSPSPKALSRISKSQGPRQPPTPANFPPNALPPRPARPRPHPTPQVPLPCRDSPLPPTPSFCRPFPPLPWLCPLPRPLRPPSRWAPPSLP